MGRTGWHKAAAEREFKQAPPQIGPAIPAAGPVRADRASIPAKKHAGPIPFVGACLSWYTSTMSSTTDSTAFERGVRPLLDMILPGKAEDVLNFHPDKGLQERIETLAAKCNEGELSDEEREEYEGYVRANTFIAILQRQARRLLGSRP
jgi:hypothetical protein